MARKRLPAVDRPFLVSGDTIQIFSGDLVAYVTRHSSFVEIHYAIALETVESTNYFGEKCDKLRVISYKHEYDWKTSEWSFSTGVVVLGHPEYVVKLHPDNVPPEKLSTLKRAWSETKMSDVRQQ